MDFDLGPSAGARLNRRKNVDDDVIDRLRRLMRQGLGRRRHFDWTCNVLRANELPSVRCFREEQPLTRMVNDEPAVSKHIDTEDHCRLPFREA